ncbi:hypothetical protein [Thermomonas paludicola]|uniref:hypothetical protein n=1 Tax=Thermomonas paludicola TaxID=2884874 RepID=UPI0021159196|nr:hypothetical protein [Thermomonas paludicola]
MEADIAQIKVLLWIILCLLLFFIASNILCRIFNCGQPRSEKFGDLWQKGQIDDLIAKTRLRLQEHPHDISALYFGAKALAASGLHDSARGYIQRLMLIEPTLHDQCKEQLDAIDRLSGGT